MPPAKERDESKRDPKQSLRLSAVIDGTAMDERLSARAKEIESEDLSGERPISHSDSEGLVARVSRAFGLKPKTQ